MGEGCSEQVWDQRPPGVPGALSLPANALSLRGARSTPHPWTSLGSTLIHSLENIWALHVPTMGHTTHPSEVYSGVPQTCLQPSPHSQSPSTISLALLLPHRPAVNLL